MITTLNHYTFTIQIGINIYISIEDYFLVSQFRSNDQGIGSK